jgi:hypothetical protein
MPTTSSGALIFRRKARKFKILRWQEAGLK